MILLNAPPQPRLLDFLVVGTGRCGTVFMARLLTSLGIPCGHEMYFTHDLAQPSVKLSREGQTSYISTVRRVTHADGSWTDTQLDPWLTPGVEVNSDASYMAVPYLDSPLLAQRTRVIEVVRNPLKVISSFVKDAHYFADRRPANPWEKFINTHLPGVLAHESALHRTCDYYTRWMRMVAEKRPSRIVHRIEDGVTPALLMGLGRSDATEYFNEVANSWRPKREDFRLGDLPQPWRDEVAAIAKRLRYDL